MTYVFVIKPFFLKKINSVLFFELLFPLLAFKNKKDGGGFPYKFSEEIGLRLGPGDPPSPPAGTKVSSI